VVASLSFDNGVRCNLEDVRLPKRVIALTISPFDKFPLPRHGVFDDANPARETLYSYLGSRSRGGRAGANFLLYNILENLVQRSKHARSESGGLLNIFYFLGYAPRIRFQYIRRMPRSFFESASHPRLFDRSLEELKANASLSRRQILRYIDRGVVSVDRVREALQLVERGRIADGKIEVETFVATNGFEFKNPELLSAATDLRKLGVLSLNSVIIQHASGRDIDLLEASSGELSILTAFLGVASSIEDGSLLLIDEPELSLHPKWQQEYIELLDSTFRAFFGCHYVVATHSPLIVSDAPEVSSRIINFDGDQKEATKARASGESSDLILAKIFGLGSDRNYFIRDLIVKVLRYLSRGDLVSDEFKSALTQLKEIEFTLPADSTFRSLISEIEKATRRSDASN